MKWQIVAVILAVLTVLTIFTACGKETPKIAGSDPGEAQKDTSTANWKQEPQPMIPETPELPGTLVGVNYATGGGMMAGSDFRICLNQKEIEHTEFWPYEYADEMAVREHVPITQQQWADVETVILELYQDGMLEAYRPKPEPENSPMDAFVLDGGDYTNLSLVWETADGTEEIGYYWPSDRRVHTLIGLLQELADPQGREIIWYEKRELDQIWISRNHLFMTERDYSFQFFWADYDENDPHWKLTYYLGKHGEVANGHIRMEQADWDAFLIFAEELQLEYFPEVKKDDKRFTCKLNYTDGSYQYIQLNRETEERIETYFLNLVQQKENELT